MPVVLRTGGCATVMFAAPLETPLTVIERSSGAATGGLAPPLEFGPQASPPESGPSWKATVDPLGSSLAMLSLVELKPSCKTSDPPMLHPPSPSSPAAITRSGTSRVSPSFTLTSSNCVGAGELSRRLVTVSANAAEANANVSTADNAKTLNGRPREPPSRPLPLPRAIPIVLNIFAISSKTQRAPSGQSSGPPYGDAPTTRWAVLCTCSKQTTRRPRTRGALFCCIQFYEVAPTADHDI